MANGTISANPTKTKTMYNCDDNSGPAHIEGESPEEAAQEYVDSLDYEAGICHVDVYWTDADGDERHTVEHPVVAATEPACEAGKDHSWTSPESLGGCAENPGVWGHGGGCTIEEVCEHCGQHRMTDTWAQCSECGDQGHTIIEYPESDDTEYDEPDDDDGIDESDESDED